jgi:hypothetical protein
VSILTTFPIQKEKRKQQEANEKAVGQGWRGRLLLCPDHSCSRTLTADTIAIQGKQAFIKEHAIFLSGPEKLFACVYGDEVGYKPKSTHTNPTSLPDRFLSAFQPIFQIRHPALMFPSMLRAQSRVMENSNTRNPRVYCSLTLRHSRALYDWYLENENKTGRKPRIIDADDIMNNPAAVRQLCLDTKLDPDAIQYEWEEQKEENVLKASFLSTLNTSKGIVKGLDSCDLNIETEKSKWKAEFGDETGEEMAEFVYKAMPDYLYLLNQPTRATGDCAVAEQTT